MGSDVLAMAGSRCVRRGVAGGKARLTFLGGTMAMASLGGMEMWCGRLSFSPFMERRNWIPS